MCWRRLFLFHVFHTKLFVSVCLISGGGDINGGGVPAAGRAGDLSSSCDTRYNCLHTYSNEAIAPSEIELSQLMCSLTSAWTKEIERFSGTFGATVMLLKHPGESDTGNLNNKKECLEFDGIIASAHAKPVFVSTRFKASFRCQNKRAIPKSGDFNSDLESTSSSLPRLCVCTPEVLLRWQAN